MSDFRLATLSRAVASSTLLILAASDAFAHAHLRNANPPPGAAVSSPTEIRLQFSEGVEPRFSEVTLSAADGAMISLGGAKVVGSEADVLVIPIGKPLAPGAYTVRWSAVSVDSHRTEGTFGFTVK